MEYMQSPEFKGFSSSTEGREDIKVKAESNLQSSLYRGTWTVPFTDIDIRIYDQAALPVYDIGKAKKDVARIRLTSPVGSYDKSFYKSLDPDIQTKRTFIENWATAVSFPVTLPQMAIKYFNKGETLILPDIGKELSKRKTSTVQGAYSGTVSELISRGTGKEGTGFFKQARDNPSMTGIATAGELIGFKMISGTYKAVKPKFLKGINKFGTRFPKFQKLSFYTTRYRPDLIMRQHWRSYLNRSKGIVRDYFRESGGIANKFYQNINQFKMSNLRGMKPPSPMLESFWTKYYNVKTNLYSLGARLKIISPKSVYPVGYNWNINTDPFITGEYYLPRYKGIRPQSYQYKYYSSYTPSKLSLHLSKMKIQKQLRFKNQKIINRSLTTYTKTIINPKKPWEASFISSSNKQFIDNINLEKTSYAQFGYDITPEKLLQSSNLFGKKGDVYTLGRISSYKGQIKTSGISYYKLRPSNIFFQEIPFKGMVPYSKYLGYMGNKDYFFSLSVNKPYEFYKHLIISSDKRPIISSSITSFQNIGLGVIPSKYGGKFIEGDLTKAISQGQYISGWKKGKFVSKNLIFKPEIKKTLGIDEFVGSIDDVSKNIDDITLGSGLPSMTQNADLSLLQVFPKMGSSRIRIRTPSLNYIEGLETGITKSNIWKNIAPSIPKTSTDLKPMSFVKTGVIGLSNSKLDTNLKSININMIKTESMIKSELGLKTNQKTQTLTLTKTNQMQKQSTLLQQSTLTKKKDISKIMTVPNINFTTTSKPSLKKTYYNKTITSIEEPFKNINIPFIPIKVNNDSKNRLKDKQAFNVMVKNRYIYQGKKKKLQKFIKINRKPLSYNDAISYGATVVDNSASRSFKIKPTSGKPVKPSIPVTNYNLIKNQFYKKKDTYIEKTKYAINTVGELRDISARGWVAERRKLYSRKSRPVIKKNQKIIKTKKINKNEMEKIMRRLGF